ncbi:MAG: DUF1211 domain-containing protein [Cryobacterium sp.]|nr:DUF1211 domain-containing protein [Oligoflexia bacterium]
MLCGWCSVNIFKFIYLENFKNKQISYNGSGESKFYKGRLEAFSDGVIAIIITIMVLELKTPHSADWEGLVHLAPIFGCYVLRFIFVGIYWNNHHHMLQIVERISGGALWANLHLLFWLSLVPFATSWMGENQFQSLPVALYGFVLLGAGMAYFVLARSLLRVHASDLRLAKVFRKDFKGIVSVAIYAVGIPLAFVNPKISLGLYAVVAVIWLVPDRRVENVIRG